MSPSARNTADGFRLLDVFTYIYVGINALLLLHPNRPAHWYEILAFHSAILAGIPLLIRFQHRSPVLRFVREWYPVLIMTFLYTGIGHMNRILTSRFFDDTVIGWELALFGTHMCTAFREAFPSKIIGEILHFGYFMYYAQLPALFLPLWLFAKREHFRTAMTVVAGTFYACYLTYTFYPVTGPYWQESIPRAIPDLEGWFFPQLTNSIVSAGSSKGSAFPSSHIGASVAMLGMSFRYLRPLFWIMLLPVIFLTLGTVYGGFHYAVDAIAGLLVGALAWTFGPRIAKA